MAPSGNEGEESPEDSSGNDGEGEDFPVVINLNVGGQLFTTTLATLRRSPSESVLRRMFSRKTGLPPAYKDRDGAYVIDRDGRHFHHILNYLRDGSLPENLSPTERRELWREADFFGLENLARHLQTPRRRKSSFSYYSRYNDLDEEVLTAAEMNSVVADLDGSELTAEAFDEQLCLGALERWVNFDRFFKDEILGRLESHLKNKIMKSTDLCWPRFVEDPENEDPTHVRIALTCKSYIETLDKAKGLPAPEPAPGRPWGGPFWRDSSQVNNMTRVHVVKWQIERLGYHCEVGRGEPGIIWLDITAPRYPANVLPVAVRQGHVPKHGSTSTEREMIEREAVFGMFNNMR